MRKLLSIYILMALVACSSAPDAGEVAAKAAKQYYSYLIEGNYDTFVDGYYRQDSIPGSYREQLITNVKMYIGQQKEERRGIKEVRVVNAKADTANHAANVFLVFVYGDSTNEEIVVPMVESKGVWYLR